MKKLIQIAVIITAGVVINACSILLPPPTNLNNACGIFESKRGWYSTAREAENKWKISAALILAFIKQESSFRSNARPPRNKFFGVIPWQRSTSAYGYAQATTPAWEDYKRETGRQFVFRNNFKHAVNFIGWYNNKAVKTLKIQKNDAKNLYLAYHEGLGGYRKRSYLKKAWLIKVADKVQKQTNIYAKQIKGC